MRNLPLLLCAAALAGCAATMAPQDSSGPVAVVQRIYILPDPNFDAFYDSTLRHDFYTPATIALIEAAERCFKQAYGMDDLDYNYIVPGNDAQLSNLQLAELANDGRTARVEVRFRNGREKVLMDFYLERMDGRWLINDVAHGNGTLRASAEAACD